MLSFREWLVTERSTVEKLRKWEIPASHIYVDLPSVEQQKSFSCGAACLRAVSKYYKVGPKTEGDYIRDCNTTSETGTSPEDLKRVAKKYGLRVRTRHHMSISELKHYLRDGVPVICPMQAWGTPEQLENMTSGHYVVAIGFSDTDLYFMDPMLKSGARGHLSAEEFVNRWHDYSASGKEYKRFGMAMWKHVKDKEEQDLHKAKNIE
jgi:predicted double-glycine peptidase